jgi:hypothetical protein
VTSASALQTYAYLPRCDHATFLFDATAPVAAEDLTVLAFLHDAGITTSVLLSKTDLLSLSDLNRVRLFTAEQIQKRLGTHVPVRAMSTVSGHEPLLHDWIRDEVAPLGQQARQRAHDALARKIDVLRQQVLASLEQMGDVARTAPAPEQSASLISQMREMSAQLERTSRELLSLHDRKDAIVESALHAAIEAFGGQTDGSGGAETLRTVVIAASEDAANDVTRTLHDRAREVAAVLEEAAKETGAPAPVFEPMAHLRDIPRLDLPPLALELHPPLWAKASRRLLHRWSDDRVRDAWQSVVADAVDAFLDVLSRWATERLAELRREFEGHSRPLLTRLTGTAATRTTATRSTSSRQRDLAWLRHGRTEISHARH